VNPVKGIRQRRDIMKKRALFTLLMVAAVSSYASAVEITTTNGTGGVSGQLDFDDGGGFGGTQWHVKNSGPTSGTTRKGYIRFDTSAINFTVGSASLDLVVSHEDLDPPNKTTIHVYGITDQSLDLDTLDGSTTWANAPANDTSSAYAADLNEAALLGNFEVTNADVAGTTISFGNRALRDFLNADTNGLVTLILGRNGGNNSANLLFAGDTHGSYAAPTLRASAAVDRVNNRTTDGTGGVSGQMDYDDGGGFGGVTWHVKNNGLPNGFTRKGYIRFDTSDLDFEARNASLELVLDDVTITSARAVNVYGITNQSLDAVALTNGLPWADAPANNTGSAYAADSSEATLLGSITVRTTDGELTKSFRNQALIDFINADTNDLVTFILGRPAYDPANTLLAGDTHGTYAPPTLTADRSSITVLNSDSYISTSAGTPKTATLSFNAGEGASKLVVHVGGEGAGVSSITYNGVALTLAGTGGSRNKGIYYLDNPYSSGAANLYVELGPGQANGISIGVVSLSGTEPGVAATASASAKSVTIDTTVDDSFVMVGYTDQDNGNASAQWPLTSVYGGSIGSAKGSAGYINGVSLDEIRTYTFTGSGGSPEIYAAAFSRTPMGTVIAIR